MKKSALKFLSNLTQNLAQRIKHSTLVKLSCIALGLGVLALTMQGNAKGNLAKYRLAYAKPISQWSKPTLDKSVLDEWEEFAPLPLHAPFPADNPYSNAKKNLGEKLFNDTRLSKSGQFSCASCHHKELGFGDGLPNSYGHDGQVGRRNAPNIQMSGFFPLLFWDGRAQGLEAQVILPLSDPVEMANTTQNATKSIQKAQEYYALFVAAFGDDESKKLWAKHYPQVFRQAMGEEYEIFVREHLQEDFGKDFDKGGFDKLDFAKSSLKPSLDSGVLTKDSSTPKKDSTQAMPKTTKQGKQMPKSADDTHSKLSSLPPLKREEVKSQASAVFGNKAFHTLLKDTLPKNTQAKQASATTNPLPKSEIVKAKKLITIENITKAIATYERTLVPQNTRFNRFLKGEYSILSDKELFGLDVFRNKGECMNCHYGAILSDKKFHNIGVAFYGRGLQDLGRYEVSKNPSDSGKFRTPSLINVGKSAPYLHNGISPNLVGLIHLYDAAFPFSDTKRFSIGYDTSTDTLAPKLDPLIRELNLSIEEIEALEAFLLTL
ncbi:cytochrome-c peroxidase [Helicobacter sp. MIT 01-3238]|uniref:cytochrome-c peroxidase n=1 Tax=Helicobacter sp. MIT 01-3238 TaxID=398627 RepID=UPI000E1F9C4D|nr:cytochrome c peroxidase [Helicobacter sp. MIT 01-3238]RDU51436.1 hypothetical protein CQA40_10170 [Helicobacter sp. MIT 01-3238]